MYEMIKIATVFSGIGAPEQALKQLKIDHEIVFACDNGERELNKTYEELLEETKGMSSNKKIKYINNLYDSLKTPNYVKKSYLANYNLDQKNWIEDIRFIDGKKYKGKVDILIGGSPCQSFSTYGKKLGFEDTRGTLFYHYANLIKDMHPKAFIYENVPGIQSHDNGRTWKRILEVFNELNFDTFYFKLNAKDYGLPQSRMRVFVVGFRKSLKVKEFNEPKHIKLTKDVADYLTHDVPLKYYLGKKGFEWVTDNKKNQGRTRVNRKIIGCETANQQFNWTGDLRVEPVTKKTEIDSRIYKGYFNGNRCVARKLMPEECLRLMGFENFNIVVDDKQVYRQSGNSIAVPVLKELFKNILKII